MTNSDTPTPRPRPGRLFWIAGLAVGIIAGAVVAIQLALANAPVGQ